MKKATMKQTIFIILSLMIMGFIFYNSSRPASTSKEMSSWILSWLNGTFGWNLTSFIVRKAAHFTEFTALGFCLLPALGNHFLPKIKMRYLPPACIGFLYAISDEIHQIYVPGRSCEIRDMCIDFAGIIIGVAVAGLMNKRH